MGRRKKKGGSPAPLGQQSGGSTKPFNNPFGALSGIREELAPAPTPAPAPAAELAPPPTWSQARWGGAVKLVVSAEKKGRRGKTVTRVQGLPAGDMEVVAKEMKVALGCGATVEGGDVLLLGSLVDRAVIWLEDHGAARVVVSGGRGRSPRAGQPRAPRRGGEDAPPRSALRAGLAVDIVQKQDQASGERTSGVIQDILTRSATHPHGIKVRLEGGAVGRVKEIVDS